LIPAVDWNGCPTRAELFSAQRVKGFHVICGIGAQRMKGVSLASLPDSRNEKSGIVAGAAPLDKREDEMGLMFAYKSGLYPVRMALGSFPGAFEKIAAGVAGVPAGAVDRNVSFFGKVTAAAQNLGI